MKTPMPSKTLAPAATALLALALAPPVARAAELKLSAPSSWETVPATSSMRKTQYRLPKAKGDTEETELVVYYFGPEAGTVDANLERWFGQFEQPDGRPTKDAAKIEKKMIAKMDVTVVRVSGTYAAASMAPMMMPGHPPVTARPQSDGASTKKLNWSMFAAIVQTPAGPYFLKAVGPSKSIQAAKSGFDQLLATMKFLP